MSIHSGELELHEGPCETDPEFAVICSFIAQFGDKIDIELNIDRLKAGIENQDHLDEYLIDIHVKLLKKIRRYFVRDQWEKALIRYTLEYSYDDAAEIESVGYLKTRPTVKLELLRRLLDSQFECDQKFKAAVNLCEAGDLRLAPTGRDIHGNTYWHKHDDQGNLRIFQEKPLDYRSWKSICSNITELNDLIEQLNNIKDEKAKGEPMQEPYNPLPEIFPELFQEKKVEEIEIAQDESAKTKKGRGRKGSSKANPQLPALMEVDEENKSIPDMPPIQNGIKIEYESKFKPNGIHIRSKVYIKPEIESIESQVESTINDLISMVVGQVDFVAPVVIKSEYLTTNDIQTTTSVEEQTKPQRRKPTKKQKPSEEVLPRRSSSRIQQLQMKKIAEQEEGLKKMIETNSKKANSVTSSVDDDSRSRTSSKQNGKRTESREHKSRNGKKRRKRRSKKKGKGKKKLSWDKDDSDLSSASSVTESDGDDEDFEEEAEEDFKFEPSSYDDEFACEDEETSVEPVIIKRARTARQSIAMDGLEDQSATSIIEEDKPCGRCDKSNDPEWILLCDMCDDGYHTACCLPPLMIVPDGDWFCPSCEHKTLLIRLRELSITVTGILEALERERQKKQAKRNEAIARKKVIYEKEIKSQVNDTPRIDSIPAIETIPTEESKPKPFVADDDAASDELYQPSSNSDTEPDEDDDDADDYRANSESLSVSSKTSCDDDDEDRSKEQNYEPKPDRQPKHKRKHESDEEDELLLVRGPRKRKQRERDGDQVDVTIFSDLESESEGPGGATSDESFQASETEEEEEEDDEDLTESDSFSADTDTSLDELVWDYAKKKRKKDGSKSKPKKKKKRRYESDDSDFNPRTTRKTSRKQISYKESSEEDEADFINFD